MQIAVNKVTLLLMLLASTSLDAARGELLPLDADPALVAHRALISSRRGLQDGNKYIAIVEDGKKTGKACSTVTSQIQAWKDENTVGASDTDESVSVETVTVSTTCSVFFETTSELLVNYTRTLDNVLSVEEDLVIATTSTPASWGLNRIDQDDLPLDSSTFDISHNGSGVNVYVIDTGINYKHKDIVGRASLAMDYTSENGTGVIDGNGHGSFCAGVVGGTTYGVAKGSTLIGVKVLLSSGSGSTSNVIKGVAWAVSNQEDNYNSEPAVLSLSLGGGKSSAMNAAVQAASDAGMIVVVAAGNDADDACDSSPSSAGGSATDGDVITVGATTKTDAMASYSNYGSCVDVLAPGSSIKSIYKGSTTATATMSGTSMATPHVAGVAAALLEKHDMDKDSAQAELIALLEADMISGVDETEQRNVFLQTPRYTGPPTPPTQQPTMPPTPAPNTVCAAEDGVNYCYDYEQANFGGDFPSSSIIRGPLVSLDDTLCESTDDDFTGKVVLVPRGDCQFFDKIKIAEDQGAIAVIVRLIDSSSDLFAMTYYGNEDTDLLAVMVDYSNGISLKNMVDYSSTTIIAKLGSLTYDTTSAPSVAPTPQPTNAPTPKPTVDCSTLSKKNKCNKQDECVWVASDSTCYSVDDDLPCDAYDSESTCEEQDSCSWTVLLSESTSAACYDSDEVPAASVSVTTPSSCSKTTYTAAETLCEDNDLDVCDGDTLLAASTSTNTCKFNTAWVWSSTSCGTNKYYQVKRSASKARCKKYTAKAAVRCC